MSLPNNRKELRQRWNSGERFTFLFFYGHKPPETGVDASCFSQWFVRPFQVDGIVYLTAEHWMMAEKARLFADDDILKAILQSETPREAKALGRKVTNFDGDVWDENKFEIVCRGNHEKFSQHQDLKAYLLATAGYRPDPIESAEAPTTAVRERLSVYKTAKSQRDRVILVEAAGRDMIWGIGLGAANPKAQDPNTWRGRNLLGFALTQVREQLEAESR